MKARRVFFALWPDHRQRERMREPINAVAKTVEGRAVDRRNWHVTLVFIGIFPERGIPVLLERAAEIPVEPFHLHFDRLEYWPRPRIASLCAASVPSELQDLVNVLNSMMLDFRIQPDERIYRPHITLVRNARPFATERLAQRLTTEWSGFELIESVSGPGGAGYVPLKQ